MYYIENLINKMREVRINISGSIPQSQLAENFAEQCIEYLFPLYAKFYDCPYTEEGCLYNIESQLNKILIPIRSSLDSDVKTISREFIESFPDIYLKLVKDAKAIHAFDPASESLGEIIVSYPGFYAITMYRISHRLLELGVPVLPKLLSEFAHSKTGIDINPGAIIGESFFIDHGTGVVIGETCEIKNNVKLYQGVTLGALSVSKDMANTKRHPTVEDNVTIYSNATILGGETVIGKNSIIGGNVWLTHSVDSNSVVYNKSEITIKTSKNQEQDPYLSWSYEI